MVVLGSKSGSRFRSRWTGSHKWGGVCCGIKKRACWWESGFVNQFIRSVVLYRLRVDLDYAAFRLSHGALRFLSSHTEYAMLHVYTLWTSTWITTPPPVSQCVRTKKPLWSGPNRRVARYLVYPVGRFPFRCPGCAETTCFWCIPTRSMRHHSPVTVPAVDRVGPSINPSVGTDVSRSRPRFCRHRVAVERTGSARHAVQNSA